MDTIQGWFTNLWAASTPSIDASIKREASTLEKYLYGSDDVKTRDRRDNDPTERPRPNMNTRVTIVDINDRNNMFIPAWRALYLEKRGKLARVGMFQHVEIDEATHWTRARDTQKAAEEAGQFVPN